MSLSLLRRRPLTASYKAASAPRPAGIYTGCAGLLGLSSATDVRGKVGLCRAENRGGRWDGLVSDDSHENHLIVKYARSLIFNFANH